MGPGRHCQPPASWRCQVLVPRRAPPLPVPKGCCLAGVDGHWADTGCSEGLLQYRTAEGLSEGEFWSVR